MKSLSLTQVVAVGSFALLAAAGAKAESYEGVQPLTSAKSRAEVNAEAVREASAPDQNVVRGSRGAETMAVSRDRAGVVFEAMRTAAAPDQNVTSGSRVNSKVISTLQNPVDARAAAAGNSNRL
ncbi:hypothetical protein GmRootV59_47050 [Variovorax sp. V59]|jgi:hypothetical protein|uniref:DUF4148 domain-containing protein n=2 Tax=Variovorax TaxID=34072 RepID=A0AAE3XYI8_VARPD|nr:MULTISPECIES: DUF4148 domain-containing protein [Variovorax]MBD9668560.1 DUF4148 domain-containing protein [Variovorax sp. VRV01]MDP9966602.1 hypothetical protein [Variovorax paradoxus]MDR6426629.1 hypothetical protein [Variovorax paradoxus]MDR6450559.1 hypothetical protein [Variovorax paradoxus]TWD90994.1 hypothetical protein FB547_101663 [Variovorax beijingensis]